MGGLEFVERAAKGEKVAALCREFGLSRTTGHKWLKRFKELGYDGLEEESRRPKSTPLATAEELVMAVLEARDARPRHGPRKLELVLRSRTDDDRSSSTTCIQHISCPDASTRTATSAFEVKDFTSAKRSPVSKFSTSEQACIGSAQSWR